VPFCPANQTLVHWLSSPGVNAALIALAQRLPCSPLRLGSIAWHPRQGLLWGTLGWRGWLGGVLLSAAGALVTRLGYRRKQQAGLAKPAAARRGPENVWGSAATGPLGLALLTTAPLHGALVLLGFRPVFAAKLADTCGQRDRQALGPHTVLITSLRRVRLAPEGPISLEGTLASLVGSGAMALLLWALGPCYLSPAPLGW